MIFPSHIHEGLTEKIQLAIMPIMQMTTKQRARFQARANVLKALAHPSRLFLVEVLSEKPYCVTDLTKMVGADTSTVSKHLSILKSAGLLADKKKGKQVYYSLRMRCALNFLDCVESVLKEQIKERMSMVD